MLRTESWSKSRKTRSSLLPLIVSKESKTHPFFYFMYRDRLTQDNRESKQKSGFKKHLNMFFKRNQFRSKGNFPCYIIHNPLLFLRITQGSRTLAASIGLQGCLFPPVTRCRVEYSFDVEMPQTFIL